MSLQFTKCASLPAEAGCETRKRLLRNNNMATNFKARRFIAVVGELRVVDIFCVALLDE